mmetsp:Transcript_45033/g.104179  ORF Transcript_45033/g.104179 Transcript_45033/m.104179 type:complete len:231 (-) Transcript_45033:300-992(-)
MGKVPKKCGSVNGNAAGKATVLDQHRSTKRKAPSASITETARQLSDHVVAQALAEPLSCQSHVLHDLMRRWGKSILKARIPGIAGRVPSRAMLEAAKREVLRFYSYEESLGDESYVAKAFYLATGESNLRFDWTAAMARVRRARLDCRQEIDSWDECLAMSSGDTNALSEIYVCGTKKMTLSALTSLICHEGLHNLARRTRRGNSFLSEDLEHMAMALLGDPQLVHEQDG